jgi:hypothetical protein
LVSKSAEESAQPEEAETQDDSAPAPEAIGDDDDVIRVAPTSTIEDSEATLPIANGDSHSHSASGANGTKEESKEKEVSHPSMNTGKPLNFLQDDELSQKAQEADESNSGSKGEEERGQKGEGVMEDGFEVIPKALEHEVSHSPPLALFHIVIELIGRLNTTTSLPPPPLL